MKIRRVGEELLDADEETDDKPADMMKLILDFFKLCESA
jgi:hypothetical protein